MFAEIIEYLNWWKYPVVGEYVKSIVAGNFSISGNTVAPITIAENQWFRISGSLYNDGVYQYSDDLELTDEDFNGEIWLLAIPKSLISIFEEIQAWQSENGKPSAFQSESFGGYSYSRASVDGKPITWQTAFADRLKRWKKV